MEVMHRVDAGRAEKRGFHIRSVHSRRRALEQHVHGCRRGDGTRRRSRARRPRERRCRPRGVTSRDDVSPRTRSTPRPRAARAHSRARRAPRPVRVRRSGAPLPADESGRERPARWRARRPREQVRRIGHDGERVEGDAADDRTTDKGGVEGEREAERLALRGPQRGVPVSSTVMVLLRRRHFALRVSRRRSSRRPCPSLDGRRARGWRRSLSRVGRSTRHEGAASRRATIA